MDVLFLTVVNMSISASWALLAVLLLRLILKKAPKWITVILWGIVALRLVIPFSVESEFSLIPNNETIHPDIAMDSAPSIDTGISILNKVVNPIVEGSFAPEPSASANPLQIVFAVLPIIWLVGMALMLIYSVLSYVHLKSKIKTSVIYQENVYQSENVTSPFVFGIIKPKIMLPFNINKQDVEYVIEHELAHIIRKDNLWKPIGFLILTLHWFNPLVWIGYLLFCRDIELACDERVIKEYNNEQKAAYSEALLNCSVNRGRSAVCPLAFGEVQVKNRIKSVLSYKKPSVWIVSASVILSIVVAVCFLTNPKTTLNDELAVFLDMQVAQHNYSEGHTDGNFIVTSHKILKIDESFDKTTVYLWSMYQEYSCDDGLIINEAGSHVPTVITAKRTGKHGHYELVEYWTPRDGSYYAKDIKEKFPWYLHVKALDPLSYADEQLEFCRKAADDYFFNDDY